MPFCPQFTTTYRPRPIIDWYKSMNLLNTAFFLVLMFKLEVWFAKGRGILILENIWLDKNLCSTTWVIRTEQLKSKSAKSEFCKYLRVWSGYDAGHDSYTVCCERPLHRGANRNQHIIESKPSKWFRDNMKCSSFRSFDIVPEWSSRDHRLNLYSAG